MRDSLQKSGNPAKVSLRDYDVITKKVSLRDDVITEDSLEKTGFVFDFNCL